MLLALMYAAACGRDRATPDHERTAAPAAPAGTATASPAEATAPAPDSLRRAAPGDRRRVVVFLGNSLTAGLGVSPDSAFPAVVQGMIDSAGLAFRVVNAGVSGATTADGLQQADWLLRQPVDVLVLELGGNDALRGLPVEAMERNLRGIVERFRARHPGLPVVVAGMEAPPNLGPTYTAAFREAFRNVARAEHADLIPFLLQDVGGIASLNQPDRIHPTGRGHAIVARNVWRVLGPLLRRLQTGAKAPAA